MEFLKQSWENIGENENANTRFLADIEKDHEDVVLVNAADFELVLNKKNKKKLEQLKTRLCMCMEPDQRLVNQSL